MSDQSDAGAPPSRTHLDLRSRKPSGPVECGQKRFNIFVIDSGWNPPVSRAIREQLPLIHEMIRQHSVYLLSREQSIEIIREVPELIGHDPVFIVYDLHSPAGGGEFRGFRLNLGLLRNAEGALARLQEFIRFVVINCAAEDLEREVRRELHREGLEGMVKVLREAPIEMLM